MSEVKWYGKIIFDQEGVYTYRECDSQSEAQAFVDGFNAAKEITEDDSESSGNLEDFWTCVDQIEPEGE